MFCISVPVKSHPQYLASALASLRAQDVPLSVALMDASGDTTVAGLVEGGDLAFAWRRHGPDAGQAAAIAEGWARAPGDILGWLNDDDLLLPGALPRVAAIFDAEPDVDVVYGHGVMLDAEGAFTGYFPSISVDAKDLYGNNIVCQPAAFVRRAAVERIGGLDTALHFTMDWDLWLRLFEEGARFRFVDEPLAAVRSHPVTKTRVGGAMRWREIETLMAPRLSPRAMWRLRLGLRLSAARDNGYRVEAALLSALFAAARLGRTSVRPRAILGIDPLDNSIAGTATLVMPVVPAHDRIDLLVTADRAVDLTLATDGQTVAGARYPAAGSFVYRFAGIPAAGGLLRCRLPSPGTRWRLLRAAARVPGEAGL